MGGGTGTKGDVEEKKDYENQPFFLIPPIQQSMSPMLDGYIDVILNDALEDGGKKTFLGFITGMKDYKHSQKNVYLKRIFRDFFESFEQLKEKLKEGGLEKTAALIEMQTPDDSGFGLVQYLRAGGARGEFATYRLIQKDALLKIIKSDWSKCK